MYKLNQNQEQIVDHLLNSLVAYINEFDDNEEFQKHTTESGGVTPHVAKELHDNIKRAFKISGKDYGSDMCCFSKLDNKEFDKLPDSVKAFIAFVVNNNSELSFELLDSELMKGSELDHACNDVLSKVDLTTDVFQGVGTWDEFVRLMKAYYTNFSKKLNFSERLRKVFGMTPWGEYIDDSYGDDSYEFDVDYLIESNFKETNNYPLAVQGPKYKLEFTSKKDIDLGPLVCAEMHGNNYYSFEWKDMYRSIHKTPCRISKGDKVTLLAAVDGDFTFKNCFNVFIYIEGVNYVWSTHLNEEDFHNYRFNEWKYIDEHNEFVTDILNKLMSAM